jgi:hypothetical protein
LDYRQIRGRLSASKSLAAIADAFLEWVHKHRFLATMGVRFAHLNDI